MSYRAIVNKSPNEIDMAVCLDLDDLQFICAVLPNIISDLRAKFKTQETAFVLSKTTEEQQDELKSTKYYLKLAESLFAMAKTELALNEDLPF